MRSLLVVILLFISFSLSAQHSVQGHVIDGETNTPLVGANVFIASTTKGVSSSLDGAFKITDLPAIHFQLVISFIGYETQVLDVVPGTPVTYKIILKPSARRLASVVVRAKSSRAEWLSNLAMFKKHFIGLSENASHCTIGNPDILDFENKNGILSAVADTLLYIINNGLGYRIKVAIDKYEFKQLTIQLFYHGNLVFQPLTPKDEKQRKLWAQNRLKAYYGSQMHFFRALYNRQLIEEGYVFNLTKPVLYAKEGLISEGTADTTFRMMSKAYGKKVKVRTLYSYDHILDSATSTPEEPVLKYSGDLDVQYMHEIFGYQYIRHRRPGADPRAPQASRVKLNTPAIVQPNGQLYPQDAVEMQDYWSWELIAERLPLDYDPANDLAIVGTDVK